MSGNVEVHRKVEASVVGVEGEHESNIWTDVEKDHGSKTVNKRCCSAWKGWSDALQVMVAVMVAVIHV